MEHGQSADRFGSSKPEHAPAAGADSVVDSDYGGTRRSDLLLVAALLLPLLLIAGVLGYCAVAENGRGFNCTPEHQAMGHC